MDWPRKNYAESNKRETEDKDYVMCVEMLLLFGSWISPSIYELHFPAQAMVLQAGGGP